MQDKANLITKAQGKRLTPRAVIKAHCSWCNGGPPITCKVVNCPSHCHRTGHPESGAPSRLKAIRRTCLDCAGGPENVYNCLAWKDDPDGQPACAYYRHRFGNRDVSQKYKDARREQANKQLAESGPGATFASVKPLNGEVKG